MNSYDSYTVLYREEYSPACLLCVHLVYMQSVPLRKCMYMYLSSLRLHEEVG